MNGFQIWDSHVHICPPEIYEHWETYAARDPYFGMLTKKSENGTGTEEAWANAEEALHCAELAGVYGLVMQGWYWNDIELMYLHNDYMAQAIKNHPQRLKAFASINPMFGKEAISEIERCVSLGFCGIGELGPGANGFDFQSPQFLDVLECAVHYHLPVCIHCGEPIGHTYPGKDTTSLAPIPQLLKRYPNLKLILAHMGGGLPFYEMNPRYKELFQNVRYDTAANPLLYDIKSIKTVISMVGPNRLLYGSDFPLLLYPSVKREMDFSLFIHDITQNANLTEQEWTQFMGKNLLEFIT